MTDEIRVRRDSIGYDGRAKHDRPFIVYVGEHLLKDAKNRPRRFSSHAKAAEAARAWLVSMSQALPHPTKKKTPPTQLDRDIREAMFVSDAEIETFLETLDVTRDPEDQGMVDDAYSALMGDDKARERLTAIIREGRS